MQSAFETVVWIVCGLGLVVAIVSLIRGGRTWRDHGRGGLSLDSERADEPAPDPTAAARARDAEIRELLEARNLMRQRRGEAPVDVDQ